MHARSLVALAMYTFGMVSACRGADPPSQPSYPPSYPPPGTPYPPPGYAYPPPGHAYPPPPGYGYPPPGYAPPPGWGYPPAPPALPPYVAPPPSPAPNSDRFAAAREQCVSLTNGYRARAGAKAVTRRPDRESCADGEAASDARSGKAHGGFGLCTGAGAQNECPAWDGSSPERSLAKCLEQMFAEGPGEPYSAHGHYLNMTNTRFSGVACGFASDARGALWIVQDFF